MRIIHESNVYAALIYWSLLIKAVWGYKEVGSTAKLFKKNS